MRVEHVLEQHTKTNSGRNGVEHCLKCSLSTLMCLGPDAMCFACCLVQQWGFSVYAKALKGQSLPMRGKIMTMHSRVSADIAPRIDTALAGTPRGRGKVCAWCLCKLCLDCSRASRSTKGVLSKTSPKLWWPALIALQCPADREGTGNPATFCSCDHGRPAAKPPWITADTRQRH